MGFYDLNPDFNYHVKKIKCRNKKIKKKKKKQTQKKDYLRRTNNQRIMEKNTTMKGRKKWQPDFIPL